jgi:EAL domain-containing protein (putative c-di-GMP-specific phosphodiesterase class I)
MTDSATDMAIVQTILDLGANLDLSVVAEGIESSVTREVREQRGCTLAQGCGFGSPMSAGRLTAFMRSVRETDLLRLTA